MHQNSSKKIFASWLNEEYISKFVKLAGWIVDFADIGRIGFVKMRDITGTAQGVATGRVLSKLREVPRQSSVMISGVVCKSKAKNLSVEIDIKEITVFGKAVHPLPIDPTGRVESSLDKRLDCRALDLRNEHVSNIFMIRSEALEIIRSFLRTRLFIEVQTPKIIGSATEGGANLFALEYFKQMAFLAQSPQLYKEQLTIGLERVFEIGPYFRAEPSHTVRHLSEFTSIDLEAAFLDYNDVMDIVEELICSISDKLWKMFTTKIFNLNGITSQGQVRDIPRLTYAECLQELNERGEHIEFGDDLSDASLRILGNLHKGLYFIKDWPTRLKPFYIMEHDENAELSKSFDLQFGYLELISGGSREHDTKKLNDKLISQGLDPESFSFHLKAFDWGMPPHAGCGIGFDRLMMMITSSDNIREVVLFPRDADRLNP
ncbi:MAG TPA: aspartate--tRNA(Asn) ligase [Nitrososphaeraceae archaeon]